MAAVVRKTWAAVPDNLIAEPSTIQTQVTRGEDKKNVGVMTMTHKYFNGWEIPLDNIYKEAWLLYDGIDNSYFQGQCTIVLVGKGKRADVLVNYLCLAIQAEILANGAAELPRLAYVENGWSLVPLNGSQFDAQLVVVNCELEKVHACITKFEASLQRKKGGEMEALVNPLAAKDDGSVVLDPAYCRGGQESTLVAGSAVKTQITLLIATEYFLGRDAFSRKMAGQVAVFALFKPQEVISMRPPVSAGDEIGCRSWVVWACYSGVLRHVCACP